MPFETADIATTASYVFDWDSTAGAVGVEIANPSSAAVVGTVDRGVADNGVPTINVTLSTPTAAPTTLDEFWANLPSAPGLGTAIRGTIGVMGVEYYDPDNEQNPAGASGTEIATLYGSIASPYINLIHFSHLDDPTNEMRMRLWQPRTVSLRPVRFDDWRGASDKRLYIFVGADFIGLDFSGIPIISAGSRWWNSVTMDAHDYLVRASIAAAVDSVAPTADELFTFVDGVWLEDGVEFILAMMNGDRYDPASPQPPIVADEESLIVAASQTTLFHKIRTSGLAAVNVVNSESASHNVTVGAGISSGGLPVMMVRVNS